MGACCSCHRVYKHEGSSIEEEAKPREIDEDNIVLKGEGGARVRLQGSSKYVSMHTQQGTKGLNQDAMTVWENFSGEKDTFLCSVFDGHGPNGHMVARYVRDYLPTKVTKYYEESRAREQRIDNENNRDCYENQESDPFFLLWKHRLIKCFHEMDEELESEAPVDSYSSGCTSVTIFKKGRNLVIANLGDSRAVLCTRDSSNELVPQQLTVDLKPNLPAEKERINSRRGRVLPMKEEPNVHRVWMPDQDCPGLAMARAFGDFCLKDYGLISTPEITYRRLTDDDEFVVLASDGVRNHANKILVVVVYYKILDYVRGTIPTNRVKATTLIKSIDRYIDVALVRNVEIWDVLSNSDVIKIVASARKRSMAAKLLIDEAQKAWRYRFPCAKIDDCVVVCLFFKRPRPQMNKSVSEAHLSLNYKEAVDYDHEKRGKMDDGLETVLNCGMNDEEAEKVGQQRTNRHRRRRTTRKIELLGE